MQKRTTHGLEHSQRGSSSIGPVPPTAIVLLQRSRLRHHQALPNAAEYTANTLIEAFDEAVIQAQLDRIDDTWPEAADEFFAMAGQQFDTVDTVSWEAFYKWASNGEIIRAYKH